MPVPSAASGSTGIASVSMSVVEACRAAAVQVAYASNTLFIHATADHVPGACAQSTARHPCLALAGEARRLSGGSRGSDQAIPDDFRVQHHSGMASVPRRKRCFRFQQQLVLMR